MTDEGKVVGHTQERPIDNEGAIGHKEDTQDNQDNLEPPYSVFTHVDRWVLVSLVGLSGLFSPLTANIYLPAIPTIAKDFSTTTERINLSVTVYMVMQGVAPMFWGPLADRFGRRLMFLACTLILLLTCIGLALVPENAYWLLMLLRGLQATGSASTVALGAGVIGDITVRSERGMFFGIYQLGPMAGPSIGPVVGGALTEALGWRALFWFLVIASGVCFICLFLLLPESMRSIVGNGSIKPPPIYREPLPIVGRHRYANPPATSTLAPTKLQNPFRILMNPDIVILLFYNAVPYGAFYAITATISSQFAERYPFLSETGIGLCFLASGGGMMIGSFCSGKLLDREFQAIKKQHVAADGTPLSKETFPIEKARLRAMPFVLGVLVVTVISYGWCLQKNVSLAAPLVLHVILGITFMFVMNTTQTLIVDLLPTAGSSITACNNLFRCSSGAIFVSIIDLMFRTLHGPGWSFTLLGLLSVAALPLVLIVIRIGPKYRKKRNIAVA